MDRVSAIRDRLNSFLAPSVLEVGDDSHKHIGHAGAASGAGHYSVLIVAQAFTGRTRIERHRMVYQAVGDLMPREIHALSIRALAPDEPP